VTDSGVDRRKRLGVAWCFGMGSALPWISAFTLPLALYGWVSGQPTVWSPVLGALLGFGTVSLVAYVGVAYRHALPAARAPWVFGAFLLANFAFYAHLRLALVRLGHVYEYAGQTEWRVTPRSARPAVPLHLVVAQHVEVAEDRRPVAQRGHLGGELAGLRQL
jgi:hypothetical protein